MNRKISTLAMFAALAVLAAVMLAPVTASADDTASASRIRKCNKIKDKAKRKKCKKKAAATNPTNPQAVAPVAKVNTRLEVACPVPEDQPQTITISGTLVGDTVGGANILIYVNGPLRVTATTAPGGAFTSTFDSGDQFSRTVQVDFAGDALRNASGTSPICNLL